MQGADPVRIEQLIAQRRALTARQIEEIERPAREAEARRVETARQQAATKIASNERIVASLARELALITSLQGVERERARFVQQAVGRLADQTPARVREVERLAAALFDEARAQEESALTREQQARMIEDINRQWRALGDAQDGAVAGLERWRTETLVSLDAASQGHEVFAQQVEEIFRRRLPAAREADLRASRDWQDGVTRALRAYADEAGNAAAQAERALTGSFRRAEDELTGFLLRGRLRVADFLEGLARDLARPFVQRYLTGPLANALAGVLTPSATPATAPVASGPPIQLFPSGLYHGGGIAGDARHARLAPAAWFATAPRLHRGGLTSGEVPAILRRGEWVFTPEQMRALAPASAAKVEVRIIDQRAGGGPIETHERRGADDRRVVEVVILDAVERGIADGRLDRALRGRFAMRPAVGGR